MPSKTVSLAILDTSVYIDNFRTGRFTQKILASPFLFRGSSVVMHELLRGSRTATEQAFVRDLAASLRLITPTAKDWQDGATIVARLAAEKGYEKRKIQELSFDVLITLAARSIGAAVITLNCRDFTDIQRYRRFQLMCWE